MSKDRHNDPTNVPNFDPDAREVPLGICPNCRTRKYLSLKTPHGYWCKCDVFAALVRASDRA